MYHIIGYEAQTRSLDIISDDQSKRFGNGRPSIRRGSARYLCWPDLCTPFCSTMYSVNEGDGKRGLPIPITPDNLSVTSYVPSDTYRLTCGPCPISNKCIGQANKKLWHVSK